MRELLKQILVIGIISLVASCGKDVDVFNPVPANSGDINLFFQEVEAEPMLYAWDASQELVVKLPSKGIMTIPANAFIYGENGQLVTGMVQTNITEIIEKQNLLGNRQSTSSEGMLMDVITTLKIEAFQNDLPIYLVEGTAIRVQVIGENHSAQLRLFSGDDSEGFIDWRETQKGNFPIRPTEVYDDEEKIFLEGIEFLTYDLGWVRCGRYLNEDFGMGDASVCVELPNTFSKKNTAAFLVFRNFDTVIPLEEFNTEGIPTICEDHLLSGYWADLIVIAQAGEEGDFFFAWELISVSENLTINIVPERADLSDIMLALEGL